MKRIVTIATVVIAVGMIVFVLVRNKKTLDSKMVVSDRSQVPVSVTLKPVEMLPISGEVALPATLSADAEANVSAALAGRIATLNVELGSMVTKGEVIGQMNVKEYQIKLQSAELAIEKLQRDYERNKVLVAGNATNENAVKDSKYDLDSKLLEAEQLRNQIADGNIVAPISGVINEKRMKTGEFASVGSVIVTVVNVKKLKAEVYVPESTVFKLKPGQKATITTEVYPGEVFTGTITYVSPKGDDNHNYFTELSVLNDKSSKLKAGVYAVVKFGESTGGEALQIPKASLVDGVKNPFVYVASSGKAQQRKLVLGREFGENVEVLTGLSAGEQVVTSGQINIIDGSTIQSIGTTK